MGNYRTLRLAYRFLRIAALEDRIALLAKKYPKVPEEGIRKLVTIDPTEGKYLEWLIRHYDEISNFMSSNAAHVKNIRDALALYDKVKKSPALLDRMGLSSDIGQVDINDLYLAWFKYKDVDLASERERIEKAKKLGTSVIYDKNGYKVIEIEGNNEYAPIAACMYAKGTKWCTSQEEKAGSYLSKGPLYILFKGGQKVLQTDLKEWKDLTNKEIDIMENDELSQVLVDSGLLGDPETILWNLSHKYYAGAPKWPAVERILAQDPKAAFEYAQKTGEPFKLGEPAIASDPKTAVMYAATVLNRRFPEAEETIRTSPEWEQVYNSYIGHLEQVKKQAQGISGNRTLRLAYRLL